MDEQIEVEVVHALPQRSVLRAVRVAVGSTVVDAVLRSGILEELPGADAGQLALGRFGERVDPGAPVAAGDRIEIYRPLRIDPRQTRVERRDRR